MTDDLTPEEFDMIVERMLRHPGREGEFAARLVKEGIVSTEQAKDILFAAILLGMGLKISRGLL